MADLRTMYRVMILYMLDQAEYPLTNTQITGFMIEMEYTDYFTVQQCLSDLLHSELITAQSTQSSTRYFLTEEGSEALGFFREKISKGTRQDIRDYLRENHCTIREESTLQADYMRAAGANGWMVRCTAEEKGIPILDISLKVQTKEQAEAVCLNWKKQYTEVFALLMDTLLQ